MRHMYSILRRHEYEELAKVRLNGTVLDLGGSTQSGYHKLVQGQPLWTVVNYGDTHPGADLLFTIEEKFPLGDATYDHVVSMNVLEHIFEYQNVFQETARVLKPGGLFISAVPFMHHIHASPNDYHRYSASAFEKLAQKYGFELLYLTPLGYGLFSFFYQTICGKIPLRILRLCLLHFCVRVDCILLHMSAYRRLRDTIPLGYFWIMRKSIPTT